MTSDIKYYWISSTSPLQYGILHIPSEAVLLVWSADTWSRLTCPPSTRSLLSETRRRSFLTQQTRPVLLLLTCLQTAAPRRMPLSDSKQISPHCVLYTTVLVQLAAATEEDWEIRENRVLHPQTGRDADPCFPPQASFKFITSIFPWSEIVWQVSNQIMSENTMSDFWKANCRAVCKTECDAN